MNAEDRKRMSVEIAKMYYIEGLPQEEIACRIQMSRANVSRILRRCVEDGVVEISVHDTISLRPELARSICMQFNLQEVIIAPSGGAELDRSNRLVGERLAQYLARTLRSGMLLGITKGRTIYYAARSFDNKANIHADVIQLHGATSIKLAVSEGSRLLSTFAAKLNGQAYMMNAPIIVRSNQVKQGLIQSDLISQVIQKYSQLDIAVLEIDKPHLSSTGLQRETWLSRADILQLRDLDAASCVCGRFFNANGVSCNTGLHERLLAIDTAALRDTPITVGVAVGEHMIDATLSALFSGMINVLVIDERLAAVFEERLPNIRNSMVCT